MVLFDVINGAKTYITGTIMLLTGTGMIIDTLLGSNSGSIELGMTLVMNSLGLMGLRHGISKGLNQTEQKNINDMLDDYFTETTKK